MKLISRALSILKGSNKATSHSEDNVSSLREGTYIRIGNDNIFYTILSTKSIFLIKDFELLSPTRIKIKDLNHHVYLKGDTITASYKEKELLSVFNIVNGGRGYKIGDQVSLVGGDASFNVETNSTFPAKFVINEIDDKGAVLSFGILENGRYINPPPKICDLIGGEGTNLVFECEYKQIDDRSVIERTIEQAHIEGNGTIITLNYSLPAALKDGKFSLKKSEIILTSDYKGENKIDVPYEIARDFTPYLMLPLLVRNSLSLELLVNNAFVRLDDKARQLDDKLAQIDEKLNVLEKKNT